MRELILKTEIRQRKKKKIAMNLIYFRFSDRNDIYNLQKLYPDYSAKVGMYYLEDVLLNRILISKLFPDLITYKRHIENPDYQGIPELMIQQKDGLEIARRYARWNFFYETGTGKTLLAIEIIRMIGGKTLVIAPLTVCNDVWSPGINEVDDPMLYGDLYKFAPELYRKSQNIWAVPKKHTKQALSQCKISLINYESFLARYDLFKDEHFDTLILDESSKIRNPRSKVTQCVLEMAYKINNVYCLTGTPIKPSRFEEYFTQVACVSPTLFGRNEYRFKNKYFEKKINNPRCQHDFDWVMKEDKKKDFFDVLARCSSSVQKKDVLDLLPSTEQIRRFQLSATEQEAYRSMKSNLFVFADSGEISAANAAAATSKLRQILSGFVFDTEAMKKTKKTVYGRIGESKNNLFAELLDEIGSQQAIIWHEFRPESEMIADIMNKAGYSYGVCNGSVHAEMKSLAINNFKSGKTQFLVAHPGSVGYGHTLINCSIAIYYSLPIGRYEYFKQSKDRIDRHGQKKSCQYFYLIGQHPHQNPYRRNLIDFSILKALKEEVSLEEATMKYIKKERLIYGNNG